MPSLINEFRQKSIESVLKNLHDTFTKEITVYKNAQGICISSSPTYNSIYGDKGPTQSIQYEMISKTFMARIYFVKSQNTKRIKQKIFMGLITVIIPAVNPKRILFLLVL